VHSQRPVVHASLNGDHGYLSVDLGEELAAGLVLGASVSVNGVCLTASRIEENIIRFDVIASTIERTNLAALRTGDLVNVERSFIVGSENGGHEVSGHVDLTATVTRRELTEGNCCLHLELSPFWMRYIFPHGFAALNGVSMTVSDVLRESNQFSIWLIPETISRTNLGNLDVGSQVNVEIHRGVQVVVDTVESAVERFLSKSLAEGKLNISELKGISETMMRLPVAPSSEK
jgi:riboflavin synthase